MTSLAQNQGSSIVRWILLLCLILTSCTQSADIDNERPTATGPTATSSATTLVGEVPPETLAADSLSFSVLGLPDEVTSYERLSIGVTSSIPECRFELVAPDLLWAETDDQVNFEFNAPIVHRPSEEFSISIRSIADSACPAKTEVLELRVIRVEPKLDVVVPEAAEGLTTDHYRVADLGFGGLEVTETYTATICYPTPDDCVTSENEIFFPDAMNMATGDFNSDGFEDVVVAWYVGPHTTEEEQKVEGPIHIYLNDGDGHLFEDPSIFQDGVVPSRPFAYRIVVDDFNGDGVDDVFAGSMGLQVRFEDPSQDYIAPYPHLLLLSSEAGEFVDAVENIDDENQGSGLQCNFAHDASGGDFDNDADVDLYACNMLLVNDGSGSFTIHPFINLEWQQQHGNPMSSLLLDLNNDGFDDLVFWNFDNRFEFERHPEEGLILLSDGTADIAAWKRLELPPGPFSIDHNKYNHAVGGDLNGDGFADAVVAITKDEPYYEGAYLQVLINDGAGALLDETTGRFPSQPRADHHDGEANIYLRDLDGDGDLDIFQSTHSYESSVWGESHDSPFSGAHIAVNDGDGNFISVQSDDLPKRPDGEAVAAPLHRGLPIDIDGRGCLDLVSASDIIYGEGSTTSYLFTVINTDCDIP